MTDRRSYTVASAQQYLGARALVPPPPQSTDTTPSTPTPTNPTISKANPAHHPYSTTAYSTATTDLTALVRSSQTAGYRFPTPKTFSPTDEAQERERVRELRCRASSDTLGRSGVVERGLGWELGKLGTAVEVEREEDKGQGEQGYGSGEEEWGDEVGKGKEAATHTGLGALSLEPTVFGSAEKLGGKVTGSSGVPIIASPLPTPKHRFTTSSDCPNNTTTTTAQFLQPQVTIISPPTSPPSAGSITRGGHSAAHSPHSSAGSNSTEIYFSPIDATRSQVFLSSPLPSPPLPVPSREMSVGSERSLTPELRPRARSDLATGTGFEAPSTAGLGARLGLDSGSGAGQEMSEIAGIGRILEGVGITLSLQQLDALTLSLALSPLVQKHIRAPSSNPSHTTEARGVLPSPPPSPPAPPLSYPPSTAPSAGIGGIALLDSTAPGVPVRMSSAPCLAVGTSVCLHLPPTQSTSSILRIEPAGHEMGELKIVLQILVAVLPRGASARRDDGGQGRDGREVLLAEVDVTTSFQRAALTELASLHSLSLDDVQIATPISRYSTSSLDARSETRSGTKKRKERLTTLTHWPSSESLDIDWCAIDNSPPSPSLSLHPSSTSSTTSSTTSSRRHDPATPPNRGSFVQDILAEAQHRFQELHAEACTMQTLTLLSELHRVAREHSESLVLQPTRRDASGIVRGVKIPSISPALQFRLRSAGQSGGRSVGYGREGATTPGSTLTATTTTGGSETPVSKARRFRETILEAVGPHLRAEEEAEFEGKVKLDSGVRIGVRCVPLFSQHGEGRAERWVCFCGV